MISTILYLNNLLKKKSQFEKVRSTSLLFKIMCYTKYSINSWKKTPPLEKFFSIVQNIQLIQGSRGSKKCKLCNLLTCKTFLRSA